MDHITEHHRGFQRLLAVVVGRHDVAADQERPQLVACGDQDGGARVAALDIGRLEAEQKIQLAVKALAVGCNGAGGEIGPSRPTAQGAFRNALKCGAKIVAPCSLASCESRIR